MEMHLGNTLPQRTTVMWMLVATSVFFAIPVLRMARRALAESGGTAVGGWAMTATILALLVLLPLGIARHMHQRTYVVTDETITWLQGDRARVEMQFADLKSVHMRYDGGLGAATPEWFNDAIVLVGPDSHGQPRVLRVSRVFVTTLHPLLLQIAEELRARPGLMDAGDREVFDDRLAEGS